MNETPRYDTTRQEARGNGPSNQSLAVRADRLPPHSLEAEQAVLGCCLLDGQAVAECLEKLRDPTVFYDLRHREIYQLLLEMDRREEAVDLLTVQQRLKEANRLEAVGGLAYLASLPDAVPSAANLAYYADIVREKFLLRLLLQTCTRAIGQVYEHQGDVDGLLDGIERDLLSMSEARVEAREIHISAPLQKAVEQIENYRRGGPQMQGLPTGFDYLDKMLLGLGAGDMIVIASRPGMGKTSIGMQIVGYLAREKKVPCAVFTLEMSASQLAARLLFQEARGDFQRFRSGYFEERDIPPLTEANLGLMRAPLWLDETPGINVLQLRARARRFRRQHKIACLLVDYVQLMRPTRYYNNREQEVAEISGGLKALAKELGIPVIVLAQLNRELEKSPNRRPQLADLRESGAIEQDADVVAMLYEPKLKDEEKERLAAQNTDWSDHCRRINLYVAKQRNGPTGDCQFLYRKKSMRFESVYDAPAAAGAAPEAPEDLL